jgi:hypothetical protein
MINLTMTQNGADMAVVLDAVSTSLGSRMLRASLNKITARGAKLTKANLKRVLPRRGKDARWQPTGALYASIGRKTARKIKGGKGVYWGAFGARRNKSFGGNKLRKVKRNMSKRTNLGFKKIPKGSMQFAGFTEGPQKKNVIRPSRYAHLVEKGHGGPIKAKAYPFLAPAYNQLKPYVNQIMTQDLKVQYPKVILQEINRLKKKLR